MKIPIIEKLYYTPVKSLSFNNTRNLIVKKDIGIKNDRIFAFTRLIEKDESVIYEKYPEKRNLNFFLTLRNSPFLNKYNFEFKHNELSLFLNKKLINKITLDNKDNFTIFSNDLMSREKLITNTPYLIHNEDLPFFDTMPHNSISLININSVKDLEKKINRKIEFERFRANVYIKNIDPWTEYSWINKKILIDNCLCKVVKKISRCSATNLIPKFDISDMNLPRKLRECYGSSDMGIYLRPLSDGEIKSGGIIKL